MPELLGPRLEQRGRYWSADLRPWGGERLSLRDPKAPGWKPETKSPGARTEDAAVARRWAQAYVDALRDRDRRTALGMGPAARRLGGATDEWLADRKREGKAANTLQADRTAIRHLLEWAGSTATTKDVDAALLRGMFRDFQDKGYLASTLGGYRDSLRLFCAYLKQGTKNAAEAVKLPKRAAPDAAPWDNDQMRSLRIAADELDRQRGWPFSLRTAVELGLNAGLRQQELFALDWQAINAATCTARITRQLADNGQRFAPLKGRVNRTTLLLPDWWTEHVDGKTGLVLGSPRGRVGYTRSDQRRAIVAVLIRAGLYRTGAGWHSLRHSYSRLFLERGGSMEDLQRSLGHASITITERVYGHLRPDFSAERARQRIYGGAALRAV
jgi:site-specific recombinase XerD